MSKPLYFSLLVGVVCSVTACKKHADEPPKTLPAPSSIAIPTASVAAKPAVPAKTYDGPFGLASAMPVAELVRLDFKPTDFNPTIFVGPAPKPMEGIDEYAVVATPETGSCRILARANVPLVNDTGDQVKQRVDQLAELMATKYGKHSSKTDLVTQDVYRRNPEFWMMALKEDSAAYGYTWKAGKTQQALPADIDYIEITALAVETKSAWVSVKYTFKNFDACAKETKKRKAASL
jgi:hypothetical protein